MGWHLCRGTNESAGKRKSGKTRKGNAWVMRLLCEFAQAASRNRCALKDKFAALSIRKGHKKSIVAPAHTMRRIVYAVLENKTPYLDKAGDSGRIRPCNEMHRVGYVDLARLHVHCRLIILKIRRQHHDLVRLAPGAVTHAQRCFSR